MDELNKNVEELLLKPDNGIEKQCIEKPIKYTRSCFFW